MENEQDQLQGIMGLDMRSDMSVVPEEIAILKSLKGINFMGNKLSHFPAQFSHLPKLQNLQLSENLFTEIPPPIFDLPALTAVDFGRNAITRIPDPIGKLKRLTSLSIKYNKLSYISPEIGSLGNLVELFLTVNQLKTLPLELTLLTNLKFLDLRDNPLKSVPAILKRSRVNAIRTNKMIQEADAEEETEEKEPVKEEQYIPGPMPKMFDDLVALEELKQEPDPWAIVEEVVEELIVQVETRSTIEQVVEEVVGELVTEVETRSTIEQVVSELVSKVEVEMRKLEKEIEPAKVEEPTVIERFLSCLGRVRDRVLLFLSWLYNQIMQIK